MPRLSSRNVSSAGSKSSIELISYKTAGRNNNGDIKVHVTDMYGDGTERDPSASEWVIVRAGELAQKVKGFVGRVCDVAKEVVYADEPNE